MRISRAFPLAFVVGLLLCAFPDANAQTPGLQGTVRDSATGAPVAGTVVLALDGIGVTLARTITNSRGRYQLSASKGALLVRAVRIGYRAATERIPLVAADGVTIDLVIATSPHEIQTIQIAGARGCPVRTDQMQASSLLEQARAGLLATVVARERQPAQLVVLRYDRELDLDGIEIESQTVRVDSSAKATTSFNAVRNAVDFVNGGFRSGPIGQYTYFGPDADVLLDERFQRGYCFSIAARDSTRDSQVGLRFSPADSRNGRVDIDGTLWIDTAARSLHDITYKYVGIEPLGESFNAGGRVNFVTLPSGVPFIDRWTMRLVGGNDVGDGRISLQSYTIRETGGELARARWPDGETWVGAHANVLLTAVTEGGAPAKNAELNLVGTDYRARADSLGRITFNHVLPGPYTVAVDDEALAPIGVQLPAGKSFTVNRNSTAIARVTLPTAVKIFAQRCGASMPTDKNIWVISRVFSADGKPAVGVHWRASVQDRGRWKVVSDNGITSVDGLMIACRSIPRDARFEIAAWRDPKDAIRVQRTGSDLFNVVRVVLPSVVHTVASATSRDNGRGTVMVTGSVRDSVTNALVNDARVTFVGTPFEGSTDVSGTFVVSGLAPGVYTVEVSTPALDSVGVVRRTSVTLSATQTDPLDLFIPAHTAVLASACGASNSGFVAGTVATRADHQIPNGLRVVAEWEELLPDSLKTVASTSVSRTRWTGGNVGSNGTYRVCGLPAATRVVLRTESDSVSLWNSRPRTLSLFPDRQFARVDLELDSLEASRATLIGTVIGDTSGSSLENVEVSLTDINRTVYTDRRGNFRLSDVPVGVHLVTVKRVGYAPYTTPVDLVANRVEDLAVSLNRLTAMATISVAADPMLKEFDARKQIGVGRFLGRDDLEKQQGRKLGDIVSTMGGFGAITGGGGRSYIVGKRPPTHIPTSSKIDTKNFGTIQGLVAYTGEDMADQGIACPSHAILGIPRCACFAQVYLDGRLLNNERPTEPIDMNAYNADDIAGVEFYSTAASTPGRYSSLNAQCGVMLVWTRRFGDGTPARTH